MSANKVGSSNIMKFNILFNKLTVFVASLFLIFSTSVVADVHKKPGKKPGMTKAQIKDFLSKGSTNGAPVQKLLEQKFVLYSNPSLRPTFAYIDGKLKFIHLKNKGAPVIVNVFENSHVLGEGDKLLLKTPNVKNIYIEVRPYDPTLSKRMRDLYLTRTYLFTRKEGELFSIHNVPEDTLFDDYILETVRSAYSEESDNNKNGNTQDKTED